MKQFFDDYTGDVVTSRGIIHFEDGIEIIQKERKKGSGGFRPNSGRKIKNKSGKAVTISFSCSPEQKAQIKNLSANAKISLSEFIVSKIFA